MRGRGPLGALLLLLALPVGGQAQEPPARGPGATSSPVPHVERPDAIRGIYLNAWQAGSTVRIDAATGLARRTEINTFVLDLKDATGYVSHPTGVGLARELGADGEVRIRNPRALLERLDAEGIYPVARIVVFKDALLPEVRPDLAIQDSTGAAWRDGRGDRWVNPYHPEVWEYHLALAREAAELGFAEIQWDYVRFPDRPGSELWEVVYPGAEGRSRSAIIREFLAWSREELSDLGIPVTADVFGVATTATSDVGIGQRWEDVVDVVDAVLPMIYPSHYYPGSFGFDQPNAHPYEVVRLALEAALRRSAEVEGAGRIIPWLQDFSLGEPRYGPEEVRAQIRAVHDVGLDEWILWNASGRYTEEALSPARPDSVRRSPR